MVSHSMFPFTTTEHSPFVYTAMRNLPEEEEPSTDSIISTLSSSSSSTSSAQSVSPTPLVNHSSSSAAATASVNNNNHNNNNYYYNNQNNSNNGKNSNSSILNSQQSVPAESTDNSSSQLSKTHNVFSLSADQLPVSASNAARSKQNSLLNNNQRHFSLPNRSESLGLSAFRPASELIADHLSTKESSTSSSSCSSSSSSSSTRAETNNNNNNNNNNNQHQPTVRSYSADEELEFWSSANALCPPSNILTGGRQATIAVSRNCTLNPPPTATSCRHCGSTSSLSSSFGSTSSLSASLPNSAPPTQQTLISPFSLSFFAASSPCPSPAPTSNLNESNADLTASQRYQKLENSLNQTFAAGSHHLLVNGGRVRSRHNSTGAVAAGELLLHSQSTASTNSIQLQIGDLVEIDRTLYAHWALYIGNGQVVHIVDEQTNHDLPSSNWALVKVDSLINVAQSSFVRPNNKEVPAKERLLTAHAPTEVVQRALQMVGKLVPYNTLTRNSEFYLTEWKYGKGWSDQAKVAMSTMKILRRDFSAGHQFYVNTLNSVLNSPGAYSPGSPSSLMRSYSLTSSTGSQTEPVA